MGAGAETQKIHERMERSQEAIDRFARIVDDYRAIKKLTPDAKARERLDDLIKLNNDTLALLKRGLVISEGDLSRSERNVGKG